MSDIFEQENEILDLEKGIIANDIDEMSLEKADLETCSVTMSQFKSGINQSV